MKKDFFKKIWPIIKERKILRTLGLLNIIFLLFVIVFLSITLSYSQKAQSNQDEIKKNEQTLISLQKIALDSGKKEEVNIDVFQSKSFAGYDEVVPFIALLENLFSEVDPKAEIIIESQDDQIFHDHFADYSVNLKNNQKDKFFKALEELYDSRFITKIMNFSINYKPVEKDGLNDLRDVNFVVRLFLK